MVMAPHPDDETLATGGLLPQAVATSAVVAGLAPTGSRCCRTVTRCSHLCRQCDQENTTADHVEESPLDERHHFVQSAGSRLLMRPSYSLGGGGLDLLMGFLDP